METRDLLGGTKENSVLNDEGLFICPEAIKGKSKKLSWCPDLWTVAFCVSVVSGGPANLALVLPEDGADQLTRARVPEDVGAIGVRRLAVVLAKLALPTRLELTSVSPFDILDRCVN